MPIQSPSAPGTMPSTPKAQRDDPIPPTTPGTRVLDRCLSVFGATLVRFWCDLGPNLSLANQPLSPAAEYQVTARTQNLCTLSNNSPPDTHTARPIFRRGKATNDTNVRPKQLERRRCRPLQAKDGPSDDDLSRLLALPGMSKIALATGVSGSGFLGDSG